MDRARFVTVDVLAQAVEVARAETPRHGEELGAEDALAELWHVEQIRTRCDEDLVDVEEPRAGPRHPERVTVLHHQRAESHDAASRRHQLIAGRRELTARHRRDRQAGRVVGRARPAHVLGQRERRRSHGSEMFDAQVDAPDIAGHEHGGMDPSAGTQARTARPDEGERNGGGRQEARPDDEQFEDAEHAGGDDRDDPGGHRHEALPVQHGITGRSARARPRTPR